METAINSLSPIDDEYKEVQAMFNTHSGWFNNQTGKKFILKIVDIERVTNLRLYQNFCRKKEEYVSKYGSVRTVKLFHGTKMDNIASILENNLDVNRHGQNVGHRFGAGVSFSAFASYAAHYCDKNERDIMLLCEVLISNIVEVKENKNKKVIRQPPFLPNRCQRYDTTAKNKITMDVVVKFEKDSFYPAYMITFDRKLKQTSSSSVIKGPSLGESNFYPNNCHSSVAQSHSHAYPSHEDPSQTHDHVYSSRSNVSASHLNYRQYNSSVIPRSYAAAARGYPTTCPRDSYSSQTHSYVYSRRSNVNASHSKVNLNPVTSQSYSRGVSDHSSPYNGNHDLQIMQILFCVMVVIFYLLVAWLRESLGIK